MSRNSLAASAGSSTSRPPWPLVIGVIALLLVVGTAWFLSRPSPADGDAVRGVTEIDVLDNDFEAPVIEVESGTTVTWTFVGDSLHDVVGEGWGQPEAVSSGTFAHTFDTPGEYRYTCTLHGSMDGRVDVVAADA